MRLTLYHIDEARKGHMRQLRGAPHVLSRHEEHPLHLPRHRAEVCWTMVRRLSCRTGSPGDSQGQA